MLEMHLKLHLNLKLQKLKSVLQEPFGNINTMLLGDFIQFPPVSDTPLYTPNIKPLFAYTKRTQKQVIGKSLWENYVMPNKIILTEQMRQ
jgi:hypothetical protein